MRYTLFILFLGLLLSFTELKAEKAQDFLSYSKVELKSGSPTLYSGKKMGFGFKDPEYGTVNSGDVFLGTYILVDNSSPENPKFWYWVIKKDSTSTLGSLPFDNSEANLRTAKMNLENDTDVDYTYPIEIAYNEKENQFYYKWIGSSKNNRPEAVEASSKMKAGSQMPSFTVQILDGSKFEFEKVENKIVVINWWSTTCSPCIAELPGLNKLVKKYKTNPEIIFLAIAWDSEGKLKSFLEKRSFEYQQALYNERTVELFGGAFPRNLVIDKTGNISYNELGANEDQWEKVDQVIQMLLQE